MTVREEIVEELRKQLIGPREAPTESISDLPTRRYIVGTLYPHDSSVGEEVDANQEESAEEGEGGVSPGVRGAVSEELSPSSMGLTVVLGAKVGKLNISVEWATFGKPIGLEGKERREARFQREPKSHHIEVVPSDIDTRPHRETLTIPTDAAGRVLELLVQSRGGPGGTRFVSVFLSNLADSTDDKALQAERCTYSPRITLESPNGFLARDDPQSHQRDDDLRSLSLLYRRRHEFATGHGCSVVWKETLEEQGVATCSRVETTFLPTFAQRKMTWGSFTGNLRIAPLMDPRRFNDSLGVLRQLVEEYSSWIDSTFSKKERDGILPRHLEPFQRHEQDCRTALERMNSGLAILEHDPDAKEAFLFMNEAMYLQRLHSQDVYEARKSGLAYCDPDPLASGNLSGIRWRAFQIAFILECIPEIVDPHGPHRKTADLLWVGTGGGKTEAYLGLAAFAMAHRRIKHGPGVTASGGVAVLMRYTLRLLTIQQFQRAATLICACEKIRLSNSAKWGDSKNPFSVGLFVGRKTTPNQIGKPRPGAGSPAGRSKGDRPPATAYEAWDRFKKKPDSLPEAPNPFQLSNCPWCGTDLGPESYTVDPDSAHITTKCPRKGCFFHNQDIQATTVDEDIYHHLPTVLIGTVDKFAGLPRYPAMASLFGHVSRYCPQHAFIGRGDPDSHQHTNQRSAASVPADGLPPPDLIIQDELHLINGPLGSLVGLYEVALEGLCKRGSGEGAVLPKVVASTATVRRAPTQVWAVFGRKVQRFPPPGTDIVDSFFVQESQSNEEDKLFVGVTPSGIGQKTLLKRVMVSLLDQIQTIRDRPAPPTPVAQWDPYWTVVSYHNSIRELGSAKTTIEDDVNNDLRVRKAVQVQELTARLDASRLPTILKNLDKAGTEPNSVSLLQCSNMFSVGVDIQRLGLMVVNSQPKTTSEYVQATGRVGRRGDGLIVVLYSWSRPRDQSHFERFYDYHNRIQIHVESMSVTPFSQGSRERGLHAQYVALVRGRGPLDLTPDSKAASFDAMARSSKRLTEIADEILLRIRELEPTMEAAARAELESFLDDWVDSAEYHPDLRYELSEGGRRYAKRGSSYVMVSSPEDRDSRVFQGPRKLTPTSLRNVEPEVYLTPT